MRKRYIFIGAIILIVLYFIFRPYLGKKFVNDKIDRDSEWYVNDLYMSDQYYYDNILTASEQEIYKELLEAIKNIDENIVIERCDLNKIMDALIMDHPELINLTTYSYKILSSEIIIEPKYITTSEKKLNRMIAEVQTVITKVEKKTRNMDEFEKEQYIYEYLGENSRYRTQNLSNQSAYTGLVKGENTVCAGYGKGAQILFQNVGLDSYILLGNQHLWNLVCIEDEWYYFDATCTYVPNCYNTISYSGLNMDLAQTYGNDAYGVLYPAGLPQPNGAKYNYFTYMDYVLDDVYDFDKIEEIIEDLDKDDEFLEFRLVNVTVDGFTNAFYDYADDLEDLGYDDKFSYIGNIIRIKEDW